MALYIAAQSSIICCLPAATALWIQNLGGLTVNILLNVIGYSLVSSLSSHLSNFWSRDDFLQNFFLPRLQTLETAYKLWFSRTREHRRSRRMHLVLQTIPLVFCQYEIYQGVPMQSVYSWNQCETEFFCDFEVDISNSQSTLGWS